MTLAPRIRPIAKSPLQAPLAENVADAWTKEEEMAPAAIEKQNERTNSGKGR